LARPGEKFRKALRYFLATPRLSARVRKLCMGKLNSELVKEFTGKTVDLFGKRCFDRAQSRVSVLFCEH